MSTRIRIKELRPVRLEKGYLIDGFPSVGFSSAIASESMIHASKFELAGIIDSDVFPPISVIKDGSPNYPAGIFVNEDLKTGVFLSYFTVDQSLHRDISNAMLKWAKKHKIGLIVSSVAIKSPKGSKDVRAIGSTDSARMKIRKAGLKVLKYGTVPGIPGVLLNEGCMIKQDVIVIIFHVDGKGPDFRSSVQLCLAMSQLIPGASCNIPSLQQEAKKAEMVIKKAEAESRHLKDSMYG